MLPILPGLNVQGCTGNHSYFNFLCNPNSTYEDREIRPKRPLILPSLKPANLRYKFAFNKFLLQKQISFIKKTAIFNNVTLVI